MGPSEGYKPLRELIVAQMAKYGIVATVDNVLITSGSQQALDLIAKLLINRGDRILVESPTYLGALQAFDLMGAEYVTVPIDGQGLQTRMLEGGAALRAEVHVCPAELPESRRGNALGRPAHDSWCGCRTSTASPSSKTIRTASYVTRANTSSRWSCWTA